MEAFVLILAILGAPEPDPPLSDLMMFPQRRIAKAALKMCEMHKEHLESRMKLEVWEHEWMVAALAEVEGSRQCWDWLVDAHPGPPGADYDDEFRRDRLACLKAALGPDYYRGLMPCPVPIRFFTRMD